MVRFMLKNMAMLSLVASWLFHFVLTVSLQYLRNFGSVSNISCHSLLTTLILLKRNLFVTLIQGFRI